MEKLESDLDLVILPPGDMVTRLGLCHNNNAAVTLHCIFVSTASRRQVKHPGKISLGSWFSNLTTF